MIIHKYLVREIYAALPVLLIVLLVITISYSSVVYLAEASSGVIPTSAVVKLIFLKAIGIFITFFPLIVFLTVIIGLGRLYSDHEITALKSIGMSNATVLRSLMISFIFLGILVGFFSLLARPIAYQSRYELLLDAKNTFTTAPLKSGHFYESRYSNNVYYVEKFIQTTNQAEEVFVRATEGNVTRLIYANKGYLVNNENSEYFSMHFSNGHAYSFDLKNGSDINLTFENLDINLEPIVPEELKYKRKAATTSYLHDSLIPEDIAEYQLRLMAPVKLVILAMLAVFLSKTLPRKGKYGKLVFAILIYFAYDNLELLNLYGVEHGVIGAFPGMSLALIFPISMLLIFFFKSSRA